MVGIQTGEGGVKGVEVSREGGTSREGSVRDGGDSGGVCVCVTGGDS